MDKSINDILPRFREIEGFLAVGIYAPSGEIYASLNPSSKYELHKVGILTNSVLLNTQKAAKEMKVGKGKRTIITTDDATIITQQFFADSMKQQTSKSIQLDNNSAGSTQNSQEHPSRTKLNAGLSSSEMNKSEESNVHFNIIAIFKQDVQLSVTKMKIDKIMNDIAPLIPK
ncbi:MAG: hypothetical protein K8S87_04670 [Planctomycetes bacterium]|nr:hypothetical protein [Planctomycetota bacterium]